MKQSLQDLYNKSENFKEFMANAMLFEFDAEESQEYWMEKESLSIE